MTKLESTQQLAKDPVIILGLPRTGSTYFFNLMSKDPQFRALSYWETFRLSKKYSDDWNRKKAKVALDMTNLFSPQVRAIHEVHFEAPRECTHNTQVVEIL